MRIINLLKNLCVFAVLLGGSLSVNATIVGFNSCTGATACLIAPDSAAIPNPIVRNPNNGLLLGWNERQNVVLSDDLYVNRVADPAADFLGTDLSGTFIKAGSVVSSHYFQWDPSSGFNRTVSAQLAFDSEIFAFITSDTNLFASDSALGLAGYDYADFGARGLEGRDTADFAPGGDNSLVDINWRASSPGDWTRLVTAYSPSAPVNPVPIPGSLYLLGFGMAFVGLGYKKMSK